MNRRNFLVSCLKTGVVAAALSGCATAYQPAPPAFHEALQEVYRLDAGDRLRITVFEQDDLTNTYSVDKAGYIALLKRQPGLIDARAKPSWWNSTKPGTF